MRSRTSTAYSSLDATYLASFFTSAYDTAKQGRNYTCEPPTHVLVDQHTTA